MRDKFPGYYRPSDEDFKKLWENAIFVFDANVLLNMYRYPDTARLDFLKTLEGVKERLWIPHQVAVEFQENRLSVIGEQVARYDDVSKIVAEISPILKKIDGLRLRERHPTIKPDEFIEKIVQQVTGFNAELESLRKNQPDVSDEDKIRDEIDNLFSGKVGEPFTEKEIEELYKSGKQRYEQNRPPGYEDSSKQGYHLIDGLALEKKYGDLILWLQLLKKVKSNQLKFIVLITDDEKEDWWWISRGKTIGPRPELVGEIRRAGCETFYMYRPTQFLKYAQEFLNTEIQKDSIAQVEAISAEQALSSNLASIEYDPATQVLQIEFRSGGVYQYYDVPTELYEGFMTASSQGSYFDQFIKNGRYLYRRIQ